MLGCGAHRNGKPGEQAVAQQAPVILAGVVEALLAGVGLEALEQHLRASCRLLKQRETLG